MLNRQYISAEIDEKYYKMILDRLNKGYIEEKYKLRLKNYEINSIERQIVFLKEERRRYLTNKQRRIKKR